MYGNLFKQTDGFILGKFQWCSDKIFDYIGIGNFRIAKLVMGIYCGLLTWNFFIDLELKKLTDSSIGFLLFELLGLMILFIWWKHIIDTAEELSTNTPTGFLSISISSLSSIRIYKIILLLIDLPYLFKGIISLSDPLLPLDIHYGGMYSVCDYLQRIVSFIIIYFVSCQPKPPQRSKIREFVDKLSLLRKQVATN